MDLFIQKSITNIVTFAVVIVVSIIEVKYMGKIFFFQEVSTFKKPFINNSSTQS